MEEPLGPGASPPVPADRQAGQVPELVPARMVNEFVYCPRLFHLEWVQGQFATSDDVEEGLYVHRIADTPSGDLPAPDEDLERFAGRGSRSFWLSSATLGVTAKLDVVEVDSNGSVVPVDYKKGSPDRYGKPWPADAVQSALQALLLTEAGYRVPHAEIWYAEPRRRVVVPVGVEQLDEVRQILSRLRTVAGQAEAPSPLVASPKCPRCSLVGICLPDEVNALRAQDGREERRPRIMATDPSSRPVYIQEQGAVVGVRRGRLEVTKDAELLGSFRLIDVSQLCLQGNVTVSAQAMRELFAREIPVAWFTYGGWFAGSAHGLPGKNVDLRRAQHTASDDVLLPIARRMIEGKVRNARTLLRRNSRDDVSRTVDQLKRLAEAASVAESAQALLGIEGAAARLYFERFTGMLVDDGGLDVAAFDRNGRARRPPPDPVNALLSLLYALLVKDLTTTAHMIGLDPYIGVFHRPRFGRPAAALDLAEEFRPLIADSTVIQLVNNRELRPSHVTRRAGGCQLEKDGRRAVLAAYERRMSHEIRHPVFGYRVTYRRALEVQARLLAATLVGEVPHYTPLMTR